MSGIFGAVSQGNCSEVLFYGTDYHSHLGTGYGGMAVLTDKFIRRIHDISQSQFKSKFFPDIIDLKANKGIGVISDYEEQPVYVNSKFGPFCIVTVGLIENKNELAARLLAQGMSFSEISPEGVNTSELISKLIVEGDSLIDGIERMYQQIEGSCSLLILNQDGIYAARDRVGYTPLAVAKSDNGWAVASESAAFLNLGFEVVKYLAPREIILLNEKGLAARQPGAYCGKICTFFWIYTGFPASSYEWINVETTREKSGRLLAKRDKDIEVDLVAGVPDSGIAHALGYAMESGKPYRRPLVKYSPGYGRSYVPPSQDKRDLIARMKLVPIREIIEGNRIVLCEDSIVRGTQLKNFTVKKLWECGASQVHVRPACPPLLFPCKFCLSTRSINELVARRAIRALEGKDIDDISGYLDSDSDGYAKMVEWIARDLEVTTLKYQTMQDMIRAVGLPKDKLCLYCWNGDYSIPKELSFKKGSYLRADFHTGKIGPQPRL